MREGWENVLVADFLTVLELDKALLGDVFRKDLVQESFRKNSNVEGGNCVLVFKVLCQFKFGLFRKEKHVYFIVKLRDVQYNLQVITLVISYHKEDPNIMKFL